MNTRLAHFLGGSAGRWQIREIRKVKGESLPWAERLEIADSIPFSEVAWQLQGIISNTRYTTTEEKKQLEAKQEGLGRSDSTYAVMIPIKKSEAWWQLNQDERRSIFEEQSSHTSLGLNYLPAIARRLYHCRDLSGDEPFDFITWFEFAPSDETPFDDLLVHLRSSREWDFVEREVEVRMVRMDG